MVKADPMPCSPRAVQMLLALLVLLLSVSIEPCHYGPRMVSGLPEAPSGGALYIKTPTESDYGYLSRDISIAIKNGSSYVVELWVKVIRFSTYPAGVFFIFDLIDGSGAVRFSIRLTSDRSVMFYYPFSEASAVFTAKEAWHPSWWYSYSIHLRGSAASFYVNGSSVGTSESTGFEAVGGGFSLVRVRLGKAESTKMILEGFVDSMLIVENGLPIFFEGFEEGLGSYEIVKSEGAAVDVLSASAFTTLALVADPRSLSSGGSTKLLGLLKDSANLGVANRTVYFEYDLGDGTWVLLGSAFTGVDGGFKYVWKLPDWLKGSIKVRAKFQGDEVYSASTSESVQLSVRPQPRFVLDYRYLVLLVLVALLAGILVLKRKIGLASILSSSFLLVGAFFTFLSILMIANSLGLTYYLAYQQRVIEISIFSPSGDFALWLSSLACLMILPQLLRLLSGLKYSRSLGVAYIILAVAGVSRFLGSDTASVALTILAGFAALFISVYRSKDHLFVSRSKALLIYFIGFLLVLLPIELGSSLAWIYNSLDPHYPFDGEPRWILPSIETQFFNIGYGATPVLLLMMLFAWIYVPVLESLFLRPLRRIWTARSSNHGELGEESGRLSSHPAWFSFLAKSGPKFLLFLSFVLSVYVVYYPYFYEERLIGIDTARWYYPVLRGMNDWESVKGMIQSYGGPYFLLLFCLKIATGFDPLFTVKIGPALPAILLAFSSYIFLRIAVKNEWLAAVGSLLSVFSIHATVGMFAGIFMSWLAMSEVMLFFAFFLKGSEARNRGLWVAPTVVASFLVVFTHLWTWAVAMAVATAYLLLTFLRWKLDSTRALKLRREFVFAVVVLAFCIAPVLFVLSAPPLFPSSVGAIASILPSIREVLGSMSLSFLGNVWNILVFTITYYVGGFFANPLIYLLGFLGMFKLSRYESCTGRILLLWVGLISVGSVLMDSWYQWRLLYLLPFQILALFGLNVLIDIARSLSLNVYHGRRAKGSLLLEFLLTLVVLLSLFNYALRSINFLIPS